MTEVATATSGTRLVDGRQVPEVGSWAIDPSHASFGFVARHLMAKVRGSFSGVSGVATIAEVPEESTLEIEIDANTIDTKDATRDAHLRSNDFFGVEDHPTISFRSTGSPARQGRERVAGRRRPHHQGHHPPGHRRPRVPRRRHRPLGQPAHRLLRRRPQGQPGGLGPDLERPPGDGRVPVVQVGPPRDRGRAGPQVTSTCGTSAGARGFPPGRRPIARDMLADRTWIARWWPPLPGRSPLRWSAAPSSSARMRLPSGRRPPTSSPTSLLRRGCDGDVECRPSPALGVKDLEVPVATAAHHPEPRVAHGRSR